jgi:hypothetical protein
VGLPVSRHLLPERRHVYYREHLYPISPLRARSLLRERFETVEYVTVDLIRDLDLRETPWDLPKQVLPLERMRSRPVELLFELCATYLAYRCTGPVDAPVGGDADQRSAAAV